MKSETRNPTILYIQPTHIAPRRPVGTFIREFKIRRLRTTTTVKHAIVHDQNHVTVHFSRVVLRLR